MSVFRIDIQSDAARSARAVTPHPSSCSVPIVNFPARLRAGFIAT
jgi:hypothetical protein